MQNLFTAETLSIYWFTILVAVTLQTSFLTPPVGFALFYLKGVCPPEIKLSHLYKGVIPFIILQLISVIIFPGLVTRGRLLREVFRYPSNSL